MNRETIKKELVQLINTLFKDNGYDVEITENIDLIEDMGMDSIIFIAMIIEIEAKFGIIVPDDRLLMDNFKYVDEIINKIIEPGMNS